MEIALAMTLIALGIAATLAIIRATLGPTSFDRVLAVNAVGSIAVLLIAVYGFFDGRPAFHDIAMLYALINLIGTITILKFFRFGTLGDHVLHEDEEDA